MARITITIEIETGSNDQVIISQDRKRDDETDGSVAAQTNGKKLRPDEPLDGETAPQPTGKKLRPDDPTDGETVPQTAGKKLRPIEHEGKPSGYR